MKLTKVLIVYKKSTFQIQAVEHRESRFIKLLSEGSDTVTRVKTAHSEHYDTLKLLETEIIKRGISVLAIARADLTEPVFDVDLVISVGGDGTFLDASHYLEGVPILGVNSSRSSSFGHYCMANQENLVQVLDDIESGVRLPCKLLRLELILNGSLLPERVLNEVLVGHSNPAGTSRYFIECGGQREEQRSSGIWIGPPSGSTGALRAAGGEVLPITDCRYQYVVREPWPRPHESWKLTGQLLDRGQEMTIISQMRTGSLYIDGAHIDYGFALGDELTVKGSEQDLIAYVYPEVNDIFRDKKYAHE